MTIPKHPAVHLLVLAAITALPHGCGSKASAPELSEPSVTFILVDNSSSIRGQARDGYATYVRRSVVPALQPGERLLVSPVGETITSVEPERLMEEQMPSYPDQPRNGWNDNLAIEAQKCMRDFPVKSEHLVDTRNRLQQSLPQKLLGLPKANKTYLLDGIQMASRALREYQGPSTLIIFSDGIEDSESTLRFDRPGFWKPGRTQSLLAMLREQHRIPDLAGAEVYFIGSPATSHSTAESMRAFWLAYFEAAGVAGSGIHFGPRPRFRPLQNLETPIAKNFCHTVR